jgi:mannose/cellobiose epimerase-like protein (N-acyl-D-glucosamine 2-epimerase family)
MLYDQAFTLLSLATAASSGINLKALEATSTRLLDAVLANVLPNGAIIEAGEYPYQSNAHMNLLEASLAWEGISNNCRWTQLSDDIVNLANDFFIDPEGGFLREFFDEKWSPAAGEAGRLVEPGHQFEWAWLLIRYGLLRNDLGAIARAKRLYEVGMLGVNGISRVVCDSMNDDFSIRSHRARLWPQTEWLKASLILAELSREGERAIYLDNAADAQRSLWLYLTAEGLWKDKRLPTGEFIDEPAPASSLYHIMAAYQQLAQTTRFTEAFTKTAAPLY